MLSVVNEPALEVHFNLITLEEIMSPESMTTPAMPPTEDGIDQE